MKTVPDSGPAREGFRWRKIEGEWVEVCDTCGGNCGQCGTSIGMGVPPSMDALVESLHRRLK